MSEQPAKFRWKVAWAKASWRVRGPLRNFRIRLGDKLIEWAIRFRRTPEKYVYGSYDPELGGMVRRDWQSPLRGFMVYASCGCGWWAACPEGAIWPHCPNCGRQVLPPIGTEMKDGKLVPVGPQRYGFTTRFMPEQEAVKKAGEL